MQNVEKQKNATINHMLELIIDPNVFDGLESFQREVEGMFDWLRDSQPAVGHDRVRLPGDPERETMLVRSEHGIPPDDQLWSSICKSAQIAGLSDDEIKALTA